MIDILTVLADPEDIRLAEHELLLGKMAAAPSEFEDEAERAADELCMAESIAYLRRQRWSRPIRIRYFANRSPVWHLSALLAVARSLDLEEPVARNLIGAMLSVRFPQRRIRTSHLGSRANGCLVGTTCFHVTTTPTSAVISKCADNIQSGLHPVLLAPRERVDKSRHLAEDKNIANDVTIIAIEDFIATNIIELSKGRQDEFLGILQSILAAHNRRLEEVEADLSLKIEVK